MSLLSRLLPAILLAASPPLAFAAGDLSNSSVYSETDAGNNTATDPGWPEGMAPSRVNDAARALQGALKRDWDRRGPTVTSAGTANAQTLTYSIAPTAYVQGDSYCFIVGGSLTNTSSVTLNVNALGTKAITKQGTTALQGGELVAGAVACVQYDGTQFQLLTGDPQAADLTFWGGTSGGTANALTVSLTPAAGAYVAGMHVVFKAGFTNTSTTTLNVNSLGTKNVFLSNAALSGGEIVANGIYEVVYDGTQFQLISLSGAQVGGVSAYQSYKNVIINGDLEIWQRGAGGSASIAVAASTTAYTADRFYITTGANQSHTISQQTGLANGSRYAAKIQRDSGQTGTGAMVWGTPLTTDACVALRGQTVTVSAQIKEGANQSFSHTITMSFYAGTGAEGKRGGGFTSETTVAQTTIATTTIVQRAVATSGSTVPTNITQCEVNFAWTPSGTAGADDSFTVDEVQLEIGPAPTTFDRQRFYDELLRAQVFYEKSFRYNLAPAQNVNGGNGEFAFPAITAGATVQRMAQVRFRAEKRSNTITMTYFNPAAANAQARDDTASADCSSTGTGIANRNGVQINTTGNAGTAVGNRLLINWTAEAEL